MNKQNPTLYENCPPPHEFKWSHTIWYPLEFKELVSTADGDYRMVYAINGQIPGPEIVVTEGDMVSITKIKLNQSKDAFE